MNPFKSFLSNNKFTSIAQGFLEKQSWEALRDQELTIGYDELIELTNESQEDSKVEINQLKHIEDNKIHLLITHQNTEQISLDLTIHDFKLLPKEAHLTFSPKINNIKALAKSDFINHVKIFFVNLFVVSFNDTILNKLFKDKTLSDGIYSDIIDGKIKVDFWEAIKATGLGKTFVGFSALDFCQITDLKPNEKGFGIKFNVQIPEWVKTLIIITLSSIVHRMFNAILKSKK